ncbi:MAG: histidine phosphatase family protein [Caulobacteraceae bacterium]|nr:histidine phosphatase family protein [Caulobacteraceae bacterium]
MPTDTIRPDDLAAIPSKGPLDPSHPASGHPASEGAAPGRGVIFTVRHGQPDVNRKVRLSAAEYAAWWARYELTGLKAGQTPPPSLLAKVQDAAVVLSSTRIRAIETAQAVTQGKPFEIDPTLIEAPLPPPRWPDWLRLSPFLWGIIARFWWWYFNHHEGQESRAEAEARASAVADRLTALSLQGDVVVVAHGFFNTMVRRSLKTKGWKVVESHGGLNYWCSRRLER